PPELPKSYFDAVFMGEVLSCVANPGALLRSALPFLARGGRIVITVPNHLSPRFLARAMLRREVLYYRTCFYFSPGTLRQLFDQCGIMSEECHYYQASSRRRVKRLFLFPADLIVKHVFPALAEGLIAVGRCKEVSG